MVQVLGEAPGEHIVNVAAILESLYPGIAIGPGMDCNVEQIEGVVRIANWKRQEKQPTIDELKAAEPAALAAVQAQEAKRAESDTARGEAKQALSELQPLIEHKDPAIALLAAIMQKHILATLGR